MCSCDFLEKGEKDYRTGNGIHEKIQFLTYIILTYDNICQYCVFKLAIMTYTTYFKAIMTYIKLVHDLG